MAFFSATLLGVQPLPVEIEIDLSPGLPFFQIVGLPDAILRESKTRVKSAILQGGFDFPYDKRIVLNLAPSKVKKEGSGFELALAARILTSDKQAPFPQDKNIMFLGELALDGKVRGVPEIEALSYAAHQRFSAGHKIDLLVVPQENLAHIKDLDVPVVGIEHLQDLKLDQWWESRLDFFEVGEGVAADADSGQKAELSFDQYNFTEFWVRHFLIAVTGGHHYFLCGPPGCGKTFFAEGMQTLLTELNSGSNDIERKLMNAVFNRDEKTYPWASPHHSASMAGLIGGGNPPRPGALTRAHGGILFLDELLEFSPTSLDSLREPLERGTIEIFRAGHHLQFPCQFQLIAATNPCRCGYWKDPLKNCMCQKSLRMQYQAKMSGPFFDRFDVKIFCAAPLGNEVLVSGKEVKRRLKSALRRKEKGVTWGAEAQASLERTIKRHRLSYRAQKKVRKLVETLSFIDGAAEISEESIEEACKFQIFRDLESLC